MMGTASEFMDRSWQYYFERNLFTLFQFFNDSKYSNLPCAGLPDTFAVIKQL
jgi:hypothetical protein